jgi:hypothetical protein
MYNCYYQISYQQEVKVSEKKEEPKRRFNEIRERQNIKEILS